MAGAPMAAKVPARTAGLFGNLTALAAILMTVAGCSGAAGDAAWPPLSKKWFDRATVSFHQGDVDDASLAIDNAVRVDARRPEIRLLAAKIALARLEFDRAVQLTEGLTSQQALAIRGRALWYSDRVTETADVLEHLIADPEVRDNWAVDIAKLARRGTGRKPFTMSGGLVAVSEMPRLGRSLLVPIELDGEPALAMVATGVPETVVDSAQGADPKWVSLKFADTIEVKDVPAISKDLSGYARQLNAPVKVLLGVNLLRRLRPTFDFLGGQFVVRSYEPPPPPAATMVGVHYIRGGGMLIRSTFGDPKAGKSGTLLIDTTMELPLALDEGGWKKAGKDPKTLQAIPGSKLSQGILEQLSLGALEVPGVPAVAGVGIAEIEKPLELDLDGIIGSGLMLVFRVTLADKGRTMWLEPMPVLPPEPPPAAAPAATEPPPPPATPQKPAANPGKGKAPASKGKALPPPTQSAPKAATGNPNK
ncbi:MAG: hypothetical protein ACM3ZE_09385 [Myxococcales bacterium]